MAVQTRTIKGQPLVMGDSLVQDQILLVTTDGKTVRQATGMAVLIENIWEDLQNPAGTWKRRKNEFYWIVERTDMMDEGSSDPMIKQHVSAPRPNPELFGFDFQESENDSDWTKYWKEKFRQTEASPYNGVNAVFRKEVILPGTKYIKFGNALTQGQDEAVQDPETGEWTSEEIKVDEVTVDVDDTMNLLAATQQQRIQTDLSDITGLLNNLL
jgi:hypothetical protein